MPASMVRSHHSWLTYNEPEGHLDTLVRHLTQLVGTDASIHGLTYKDDSTLARFNRHGYGRTYRYDMQSDLGVDDARAGLETVQSIIDEVLVNNLVRKHGTADLLIVRHLLEHAHAPTQFLRALSGLLAPGGKLVLEVPDCRKFINACDYSFIWEEHISYFSPQSIERFASHNRFSAIETQVFPYPLEDSLVVVMQPSKDDFAPTDDVDLEHELDANQRFGGRFEVIRQRYRTHLESLRLSGQRVAVFGAGHLAVKFLNLFDLKDCVDCVIDDNPHKQGLVMPGSGLAIVGSSKLQEIDLCLLALSPESEQKIFTKQQGYIQGGGRFASIFALSPLAIGIV
jgi:SAM-dependent methyltransferase